MGLLYQRRKRRRRRRNRGAPLKDIPEGVPKAKRRLFVTRALGKVGSERFDWF